MIIRPEVFVSAIIARQNYNGDKNVAAKFEIIDFSKLFIPWILDRGFHFGVSTTSKISIEYTHVCVCVRARGYIQIPLRYS